MIIIFLQYWSDFIEQIVDLNQHLLSTKKLKVKAIKCLSILSQVSNNDY